MCPRHDNIIFCPLYAACHEAVGLGCDDGGLADGHCAVARGMDYDAELVKIRARFPREVAMLEWKEDAERRKEQRARNLRVNGIH